MPSKEYKDYISRDIDFSSSPLEMTKAQKQENFWFYYKKTIIITTVAALFIGFFIYDIATKKTADISFAILTDRYLSQELLEQLNTGLTPYISDLNGDGSVLLEISYYQMEKQQNTLDPNTVMASTTRLMADVEAASSIIFFTDDPAFTRQRIDIFDEETEFIPFNIEKISPEIPNGEFSGFYLAKRKLFTKQQQNKKLGEKYISHSLIFEQLIA